MIHYRLYKLLWIVLAVCIFQGCSPSSPHEFRQEGESLCRKLTKQLQQVETREDLLRLAPQLKKCFSEFAELVVAARLYDKEHAGEAVAEEKFDDLASETLLEEMKRIYKIEGARKIMEDLQRESLFSLDAKIKKIEKQHLLKK